MSFLALDLGTSFIKGAVLDLDARRLSHVQRIPFPDPIGKLQPLFCEIDPSPIVAATKEVISALLPHAPDCAGVVMCTQMQGLVLTDARGQALSNYISWKDQRALLAHPSGAGTFYDVLAQRISAAERRQMGNELRPSLPLCALFWLAEQKQLPQPDAIPAPLGDFVLANLCEKTPRIEATNASAMGALNLTTMDWHRDVLAKLGLAKLHWPALCRQGEIVGHLINGSKRLPCYTPVGDQPCSMAGALLQEGELSINIATGSQVTQLSPRLVVGDHQTRPFFDGKFLKIITHIPAGRSLSALANLLTELGRKQQGALEPWEYIFQAADQVGETDLRMDLAFYPGPCGERGAITNIREDNLSVGHLFRAAFQNMAENYHACALRLSPERAWNRLVFSGGLAQKSDLLRRIICQKFQIEHRLCPSAEDALLGLLALALVFSERAPSVEQAIAGLSEKCCDTTSSQCKRVITE